MVMMTGSQPLQQLCICQFDLSPGWVRSLPLSRSLFHQPVFPEPALPGARVPPSPKLTPLNLQIIPQCKWSDLSNCVSCVFFVLNPTTSNVLDSNWVRSRITMGFQWVFHPGLTACQTMEMSCVVLVLRVSRVPAPTQLRDRLRESSSLVHSLSSLLPLL